MDIIMGGPEGAKLVKDVADSQINIYIRTAEINYCMRVNAGKINIVFRQLSKSDGYLGCSTNVQQISFNNSGYQAG